MPRLTQLSRSGTPKKVTVDEISFRLNLEDVHCKRAAPASLLEYAESHRKFDFFNDIIIYVGKTTFPANSMVLSCFSKYFEDQIKMYNNLYQNCKLNGREDIHISGVSEHTMKQIIDFIYTGSIIINGKNICKLLSASNYLQILEVKQFCSDILCNAVDSDNCIQILKLAVRHNSVLLQIKAAQVIGEHFQNYFDTKQLNHLTNEEMLACVSHLSAGGLVKEETLYNAITRWAELDVANRAIKLPELLGLIKLTKFPLEFLENSHIKSIIMGDHQLCKIFLEEQTKSFNQVRSQTVGSSIVSLGGDATPTKMTEVYNCSLDPTRTYNDIPISQGCCCSVMVKDYLYCIGGRSNEKTTATNAVLRAKIKSDFNWEAMMEMTTVRRFTAAAQFDGHLVVTGGWDGEKDLLTAEYYSPNTNSWQGMFAMQRCLIEHAVVACNGSLYAIGGVRDGMDLSPVECLSDINGTWKEVKPLQIARQWFTAVSCNGFVYVIGGKSKNADETLAAVEKYDSNSDTWSLVSSMIVPRYYCSACVMKGNIFVVGGINENSQAVKDIECYDSVKDQWNIAGTTEETLYCHSLIVL